MRTGDLELASCHRHPSGDVAAPRVVGELVQPGEPFIEWVPGDHEVVSRPQYMPLAVMTVAGDGGGIEQQSAGEAMGCPRALALGRFDQHPLQLAIRSRRGGDTVRQRCGTRGRSGGGGVEPTELCGGQVLEDGRPDHRVIEPDVVAVETSLDVHEPGPCQLLAARDGGVDSGDDDHRREVGRLIEYCQRRDQPAGIVTEVCQLRRQQRTERSRRWEHTVTEQIGEIELFEQDACVERVAARCARSRSAAPRGTSRPSRRPASSDTSWASRPES